MFPTRLGSFTRLTAPEGAVAGAIRNINPTLARQLRDFWDAANNRWNQWVLNYTQGKQLDLLSQLGFQSPSWADLLLALAVVVALVGSGGAVWMYWERQQHDPWLRLLDQARRRLERTGMPPPDRATPRGLALRVQQHWGDTPFANAMYTWLMQLEEQRYAPAHTTPTLSALRRQYRQLHWPLPSPT